MIAATRAAAEQIRALRYADLPPAVVAMAKRSMLDTLLVAWAGTSAQGSGSLDGLLALEREGPCTVWGGGGRRTAPIAAFANSFAAAALDFDSLNRSVHADAVILPAALSVAEGCASSGKAFLAAYVGGVELACRLSAAVEPSQKGWTHTAVFGIFGAAASAAKLLGIDEAGMLASFGICLSQAAGTQQANIEQMLTKRLQPALAARNGVFSAYAAQAGISGPEMAFEGRFGLWALYQACDPGVAVEKFGDWFAMLDTGIKKYPVCACSHAALDACAGLMREHALEAGDVVAAEVVISPFMHRMVGAPFNPLPNPQVAAQFSIQYALASMLSRGRMSIAEISGDAIFAPGIADLAARIVVSVDQNFSGELVPAIVKIRSRRHGLLERRVDLMPGGPEAPPSSEELMAKLESCRMQGRVPMSRPHLERLVAAVSSIEEVEDMAAFSQSFLLDSTAS